MKKKNKRFLGFTAVCGGIVLLLASCSSFCSAQDSASYRYAYDPVHTDFFETEEAAKEYVLETFQTGVIEDTTTSVYYDSSRTNEITLDNVGDITIDSVENGQIVTTSLIKSTDASDSDFNFTDEIAQNGAIYYLESGVYTVYYETVDEDTGEGTGETGSATFVFSKNSYIQALELAGTTLASNASYTSLSTLPANAFWNMLDSKTIDEMISKAEEDNYISKVASENEGITLYEFFYGYSELAYDDYVANPTDEKLEIMLNGGEYVTDDGQTDDILGRYNSLFSIYGKYKFISDDTVDELNMDDGEYWGKITQWNQEIYEENNCVDGIVMNTDYLAYYQSQLDSTVSSLNSCITISEGYYGHVYEDALYDGVLMTDKSSWGDAWSHGWLEGLLVFPIAYMVEYFSHSFGMNGWGQIAAVLLVTLIVRALFSLITLPSTIQQQKMQNLQPEMAKLQQKYPNSDSNEYEKQRLAQAQLNLYKRHKVHPFLSFLVLFIQFPLFICVWNGMRGAASLSVDAIFGLRLSDTISSVLFTWSNWPGAQCWTALILILLMSGAQIMAMLLPQILQKRRMKKVSNMVTKTVKSGAQNKSQRQMKIVQWVMTIVIIFMGFTLPSAMGVYWLAGALFSMLQTTIMHFAMARGSNRNGPKTIDKTKTKKDKKAPKDKSLGASKKKEKAEKIETETVETKKKKINTKVNEDKVIDVKDLSENKVEETPAPTEVIDTPVTAEETTTTSTEDVIDIDDLANKNS